MHFKGSCDIGLSGTFNFNAFFSYADLEKQIQALILSINKAIATQKRRYTQFDLQKRQQALDDFSNLINGPMRELYETGTKIWSDWNTKNPIAPTEFGERLDNFRAMIVAQEKSATDIMTQYERYPDLVQGINWADAPIMAATDSLRIEIRRFGNLLGPQYKPELLQNNRFTEEWREALNTLSNIIARMRDAINAKQTEYENAEIIGASK